ncbi:MAG: hypothetical protein FK730_05625 [Asgard group archaeon]|nr:hypothetical protein [Asgard group archaeon]
MIGSLISVGMAIGLIYGGIQVAWWLGIILCVIGFIVGGFIAGFISRDKFPGMIAGIITGVITFVGIFLFFMFILKAKMLDWSTTYADIGATITALLDFLGINASSGLGTWLTNTITDKFSSLGTIESLIQKYVPILSLLLGVIFGGIAFIICAISGRIGSIK